MNKHPNRIHSVLLVSVLALGAFSFAGCKLVGENPSPPSKAEQALFDTKTNYVTVTNVVPQVITTYETNEATHTVTSSSITNLLLVPGTQTQYVNTVKPAVTGTVQAVGTAVNTFAPGIGGLISSGILALLAGWSYLRSNKNRDTSAALAQEIQAVLNFIGQLPDGPKYVDVVKQFLQQHQNEADVVNQVVDLLAKQVSNSEAKAAANQVIATINGLKSVSAPITPIVPPTVGG